MRNEAGMVEHLADLTRYAWAVARKLPSYAREDAVQAGLLAACRAAERHDAERGPLKGWLIAAVKHGIDDHARATDPLSRAARTEMTRQKALDLDVVDRSHSVPLSQVPALNWAPDPDPTPEQHAVEADTRRVIREQLQTLPERERLAVIAGLRNGGLNELALELGVTPSRCSQLRTAGLRRLRPRLLALGVA